MELSGLEKLNKTFCTLRKTPWGETGCLSTLIISWFFDHPIFWFTPQKIHFQNCSLKKIPFQNWTCKAWKQIFFYFFLIFLFLSNISEKEMFLIPSLINKQNFSHSIFFFYTQPVYYLDLLRDSCNVPEHIVAFNFFLL